MSITLYCFRDHDLRLADNPALLKAITHATSHHTQLALCLCLDEQTASKPQSAIDIVRTAAIISLQQNIQALGGQLNISTKSMFKTIQELQQTHSISAVFWSRRYAPNDIAEDITIKESLKQANITAISRNAALLYEPFDSRTLKSDLTPYKVFTPFSKKLLTELSSISRPLNAPTTLTQTIDLSLTNEASIKSLPAWGKRLLSYWKVSEKQAQVQINSWLEPIKHYKVTRNMPALSNGTSKLSPYLRLGLCSPKQILYAISAYDLSLLKNVDENTLTYVKEILWREFAYYTLYHFSDTLESPFNSKFTHFPWLEPSNNDFNLQAWYKGRTGVPLVDAGMRELWQTGWMHNRVRMVVASWLCKNMGIHWHIGAKWFMRTLIDADIASNTLGWQWVAGCGVDATPYFRVFNPILQAKKFDPNAEYVKKWLPELRTMPIKHCFEPWLHNDEIKAPIMDISASRQAALNHYQQMKEF